MQHIELATTEQPKTLTKETSRTAVEKWQNEGISIFKLLCVCGGAI